jgi:hypothetical protein
MYFSNITHESIYLQKRLERYNQFIIITCRGEAPNCTLDYLLNAIAYNFFVKKP